MHSRLQDKKEKQTLDGKEALEQLCRSEFERCKSLFVRMGFEDVNDVKLEFEENEWRVGGFADFKNRTVGIVLPYFSSMYLNIFEIDCTLGHELSHIVQHDYLSNMNFEEGIAELMGSYTANKLSGNEKPSKEDVIEYLTYYAADQENADGARAQCLAVEKALYRYNGNVLEFIYAILKKPEIAAPLRSVMR
ncbi:MAG: hypothetical protein QXV13_01820 [Candidatus Micrarchaeaceae archaeon]